MKKSAILGLFAVALSASAFAQGIKEIKFGVEAEYAPFEFKDASGKLTGFDVEIGNALCAHLKAKCTWVENSFDGLIPALKAKKFDAILSSMSITEKRMQEIDFTQKIYKTPARLVGKAGMKLDTPAATKGLKIGVQQGTTHERYALAALKPAGAEIVSYQSQSLVYPDLVSGRLDATLADSIAAGDSFLKKPDGKGFAYVGPAIKDPIFGMGAGIGVRKEDTALKAALNGAIDAIKKDGTYNKIMAKYFSFDISGD